MKKLSFALLLIAAISISFISRNQKPAATALNFTESKTGTFVVFNQCTGEDVEITFRSTQTMRGSLNGQRFSFKAHYSEQQEGVGKQSGTRYTGQVHDSYNEQGSLLDGRYRFSFVSQLKMMTPGGGNNYRSKQEVIYSFNRDGEITGYIDHTDSECQ